MRDMILLIEPVIPRLRRYARVLLRDRAAADDLVQDCLERAVERWHQRRGEGDPRTWMFAILHNLAMNQLRQRARRGTAVALDEASDAALARPAEQEVGLHQRDILASLDRLPDEQRAVILLVTIEEMSYADAAETLGVPVGTVMSRLSRARARLREALSGEAAPVVHLRSVK
ncbi:RNA polymerase subunit sigma [Nostoc sp. 3335mG]|nr:RNA polymerase subunit sigma [Nostoc sp. 3335mG]